MSVEVGVLAIGQRSSAWYLTHPSLPLATPGPVAILLDQRAKNDQGMQYIEGEPTTETETTAEGSLDEKKIGRRKDRWKKGRIGKKKILCRLPHGSLPKVQDVM